MADQYRRSRGAAPSGIGPELFQILVEKTRQDAIVMLDPDGRVLTWNEGAELLFGYRADEVVGTSFARVFTPENVAAGCPQHELKTALETGRVEDDNWLVRKDGSRFWANGVTMALRGADGQFVAFAKVARDLTDVRRLEEERVQLHAREQAAVARVKAEEQLRQSDARFHLLVESVKDYAIFLLDPRGHVVSWNEGARRIKGYTEPEILGKSFALFYTPEDRARGLPEHGLEVAAAEGRYETEGWRVRKDGSRFWADVVITALRDEDGRLVGFAKVTRDLTERKRAEEEHYRLIREQEVRAAAVREERRVSTILNSITDAFMAFDHDFRLTFVNERARELIQDLLKRPGGELVGKTIWDVVPQFVGTRFEQEYRRVVADHVSTQFEEFSPPFGVWFEVHAYPSNSGALIYFRDITARKHAEEERAELLQQLDAERTWLRAVIEQSPVGVFLVEGTSGERVVANHQAERLFGHPLPPEGGIAQYAGQIYRPDGIPLTRSELVTERALHGQTVASEEALLLQPNGREVRVLASAVPIRDAGTIVGAVVVYEDITRIRELERLRDEWISYIAHDLRQPVATIIGYSGLLRHLLTARGGQREQATIEHVVTAAWNLNKMIGDLLDISRIEARRLMLERTSVDLPALVRGSVERAATVTSGHPVLVEIKGNVPPTDADPARVEQVLDNLLSNAAKYGYPDSEIRVIVEQRYAMNEVSVIDQGAGIAPEEMSRIFNRFYRTREAKAGQAGGLGLGLYISRGIVESHGGRIWAESIPGQTTAFHFTLPIDEKAP